MARVSFPWRGQGGLAPPPDLNRYEEPPRGDYALYVERLLAWSEGQRRLAASKAVAGGLRPFRLPPRRWARAQRPLPVRVARLPCPGALPLGRRGYRRAAGGRCFPAM